MKEMRNMNIKNIELKNISAKWYIKCLPRGTDLGHLE